MKQHTFEMDAAEVCMIYRGLRESLRERQNALEDGRIKDFAKPLYYANISAIAELLGRLATEIPERLVNPAVACLEGSGD